MLEEVSGSGNYTTAGFARRLLDAEVEITFETQFTWERNTDYYLNLGKNFGVAFYNAWAPDLPGDFNDDGVVDAADYVVWRNALGTGATLPNDNTPGSGIDDYETWRANFGRTATSAIPGAGASQAVPEPQALVLAILMLAPLGRSQKGNSTRIREKAPSPAVL